MSEFYKTIDIKYLYEIIDDNPWIDNFSLDRKELNYENYLEISGVSNKQELKSFFDSLNIKFIKLEVFLEEIYKQFDNIIKNDNENKKYLILTTSIKKSNFWILLLFLKYIRKYDALVNRIIVVKKYFTDIEYSTVKFDVNYTLLIFDDGSYSGSQLKNLLRNNNEIIKKSNEIYIICWISNEAISKIKELNLEIPIYFPEPLIDNIGLSQRKKELDEKNLFSFYGITSKIKNIIFEHKMADYRSIPTKLINETPFFDRDGNYQLIYPCSEKIEDNTSGLVCYKSYYNGQNNYLINNDYSKNFLINNSEYNLKGGYYIKYLIYKKKYLNLKDKYNK